MSMLFRPGKFFNRRHLLKDRSGTTLVEFALVAPPLFLMLMGLFDLGHGMYLRSVLYGVMQKAGRDSSLESGPTVMTLIDARVREAVFPILTGGTVNVQRMATKSFAAVGGGEPFTDSDKDGIHDSDECFSDENSNGSWDATTGSSGLGGTNDVVKYTATVTYDHIFPVPGLIGWEESATITISTVLRNQPYADAPNATAICP